MMSENNELVPIDNSIQWCLLSHTNIGKTTLTRTLMADDVGEIDDAAHVTTQSQRYLLACEDSASLVLDIDQPTAGNRLEFRVNRSIVVPADETMGRNRSAANFIATIAGTESPLNTPEASGSSGPYGSSSSSKRGARAKASTSASF